MDAAGILLDKIFSWAKLQRESAEQLNNLAAELEHKEKKVKKGKVVGSSLWTGGSSLGLIGVGIAACCTGGAVIPLIGGGIVLSGAGMVVRQGCSVYGGKVTTDSMERAKSILSKTEKLHEEIIGLIKSLSETRQVKHVSPEDYVVQEILRAMAKRNGLKLKDNENLLTLVSELPKALRNTDSSLNMSICKVPVLSDLVTQLVKDFSEEPAGDTSMQGYCAHALELLGWTSSSPAGRVVCTFLIKGLEQLIEDYANLDKCETEVSKHLREVAEAHQSKCEEIVSEMDQIQKVCQTLAAMKGRRAVHPVLVLFTCLLLIALAMSAVFFGSPSSFSSVVSKLTELIDVITSLSSETLGRYSGQG